MNRHRFQLFLECMRFDCEETRSELKQNINKLAAIPTVYVMLTVHSSVAYLAYTWDDIATCPEEQKCRLILMSTLHHDDQLCTEKDKRVIVDFNATKGAVDTLDELCGQYSTKRGTHRWPLSVYFTLLDICIHNTSVVLFDIDTCTGIRMASANERTVDEWRFLDAGKATSRAQNPAIWLQTSVKWAMNYIHPPVAKRTKAVVGKKGRCCQCGRAKDVKKAHSCQRCGRFVAQMFRLENDSASRTVHSLTAALDRLRVVAISTTSGSGLWIDRHWWVDPYLLPPVEAKFSVDGPEGASSQWQELCRWRHQCSDVVLVKLVYPWIIGRCGQKVSDVDRRWGKVDPLARLSPLLRYSWPRRCDYMWNDWTVSLSMGLVAIACRLSVRLWRWWIVIT